MRDRKHDESMMRLALRQAEAAGKAGETPVGAVIVRQGKVLAVGRNRREERRNALLHAEVEAIDGACRALGNWRLSGCELFVTLEPCPMCAGAILNARVDTVIIGAADLKGGACGSLIDLFACPFPHTPRVIRGVLEDECAELLRRFFARLRQG